MIDKTLQEKMLDTPLIIHGFVHDDPQCNYEQYLTELLNCSAFFMKKTEGRKFKWIANQDHGECDAVTELYSIDFKLLATKSSLQAKRETSGSITKNSDGCILFGVGRLPIGEKFTYIRTVAALRDYSVDDLNRISKSCENDIERNISVILKNVRTPKNLLLLYPYIMSFTEFHSFEEGCKAIEDAFNEDLRQLRIYRELCGPGFETYLCTVYDDKLLIFQDAGNKWILQDSVNMMESKVYRDLFYEYGNYGFNF